MNLSVVAETVQVPLAQDKNEGGGVGEGGHAEVKGLLSQDEHPVRLESTHKVCEAAAAFSDSRQTAPGAGGGTHRQPLASAAVGKVLVLTTLSLRGHGQSFVPEVRETDKDRQ